MKLSDEELFTNSPALDKIYVELDACNAALAAHLSVERVPMAALQFHPLYHALWDDEYYKMLNLLNGGVSTYPF